MKNIIFVIIFCAYAAPGSVFAQRASLEVTVSNIKNADGFILASLFTNEEEFLKTSFRSQKGSAEKDEIVLLFENIPVGSYALSVIHDENGNLELDSNFFGIPKEGFGFGNDAMGSFGPPAFEKTVIKLTEGRNQHKITLKHL